MENRNSTEERLSFIESLFVKYGARPTALNEKNRERFDQRQIFSLNGNYYRAEADVFDGSLFFVLSVTDKQDYAAVGIMEDVDALPEQADDARLEQAVRYALGIEPYPEKYPVEDGPAG